MKGNFLRAAVLFAALFWLGSVGAQTPVEVDVGVEGTGVVASGGLTFQFLDPVPVQVTSGTTVIDYRVLNSKTNAVDFTGIAAKLYGDPKSKLQVTMGHSSLTVPASGSIDSTITITTTSNMLDGDFVTIKIKGTATDVTYDYEITITASRTSFQVPGVVFFDITGSTGHNGSLVHDVASYWNMTGAVETSKRGHWPSATWDTAGTYLVSVTQIDGDGRVGYGEISVTGSAYTSGTTYYIDSGSTDGGTGTTTATSGADRAFATIGAAVTAIGSSTNYRLLLNKGNTFSYTSTFNIPAATAGNSIRIGAYGTGARPKWKHLVDTTLLRINGYHRDCSIFGIDFQGNFNTTDGGQPWTSSMSGATGGCHFLDVASETTGFEHFGVYDCNVDGFSDGVNFGGASSTDPTDPRQLCIQGCTIQHIYQYASFTIMGTGSATRLSYCDVDTVNTLGESGAGRGVFRVSSFTRAEFWGNNISGYYGSTGASDLNKINSTQGFESRYIYWGNCTFDESVSGVRSDAAIKISMEGGNTNQKVRDIIVDGCTFIGVSSGSPSWYAVQCSDKDITVRNCVGVNMLDLLTGLTDIPSDYASDVGKWSMFNNSNRSPDTNYGKLFNQGGNTAQTSIEIGNNAMRWSGTNYGEQRLIVLGSSQIGKLTHKNNLGYHSSGSSASAIYIAEGGTTYAFNSSTATTNGAIYDDPDYVSATDLHLTTGSPAINAGLFLGGNTLMDKDGVERGTPAIGAYEYVP